MGRAPVALSVTPLRTVLPQGVRQATEKITVTNAGNGPITVSSRPMSVLATRGGCGVEPAPHWMTISSVGTLQPGQSRTAVVHMNAPAGVNADIAAVFIATGTPGGSSGGHAAAGIGSQVIVQGRGTSTAPVCSRHHPVAAPAGHAGLTGPLIIGGLVLVALGVAFCFRQAWRHRPRRS